MRIQLDLADENVAQLQQLIEKAGVHTYKELFDNALALLNWAIEERQLGRRIGSIDETEQAYRELGMKILEGVERPVKSKAAL